MPVSVPRPQTSPASSLVVIFPDAILVLQGAARLSDRRVGRLHVLMATRKQKLRAAAGTPLNPAAKAAKKTSKVKKTSRGK